MLVWLLQLQEFNSLSIWSPDDWKLWRWFRVTLLMIRFLKNLSKIVYLTFSELDLKHNGAYFLKVESFLIRRERDDLRFFFTNSEQENSNCCISARLCPESKIWQQTPRHCVRGARGGRPLKMLSWRRTVSSFIIEWGMVRFCDSHSHVHNWTLAWSSSISHQSLKINIPCH